MKRISILFLIIILTGCQGFSRHLPTPTLIPEGTRSEANPTQAIPLEIKPVDGDPFKTGWDNRDIFKSNLTESASNDSNLLPGATIYHIELTIPGNMLSYAGRMEVRYTNNEITDLDELHLHLYPALFGARVDLSDILLDGNSCEADIDLPAGRLVIHLPEPLGHGESKIISLGFEVSLTSQASGNYATFGLKDNVLTLAQFYPTIAVYDELGWRDEIPPMQGDVTHNDASFYLVRVALPKTLTAVSSGAEIYRSESDSSSEITFAAGPAREYFLSVGQDLEEFSTEIDSVTIKSYAKPEYQEANHRAVEIAADALSIFTKAIGEYPYNEFEIIATGTDALGVEYPGVIAISEKLYDPNVKFGVTPSSVYFESTIAHEVGHQWFYNVVGNDQLLVPWLDESLTQYITAIYYQDHYGSDAALNFKSSWEARWDRVERKLIPIGLSVAEYPDNQYGAIVYGRGPLFFDALRVKMGKDAFSSFLKKYYAENQWEHATQAELKKVAEQECTCDLTDLFIEWVEPFQ